MKANRYFPMFVALLFLLTFATRGGAVEVYFSPGKACENQIVGAIEGSHREIQAAVYAINHPRIVEALIAAHKRGVAIQILADHTMADRPDSKVLDLLRAKVELRLHSKTVLQHNSFAIFDGSLAVNGSYNWTEAASNENSENCTVLPEANAIASFKARFLDLWASNSELKSEQYVAKILHDSHYRSVDGRVGKVIGESND